MAPCTPTIVSGKSSLPLLGSSHRAGRGGAEGRVEAVTVAAVRAREAREEEKVRGMATVMERGGGGAMAAMVTVAEAAVRARAREGVRGTGVAGGEGRADVEAGRPQKWLPRRCCRTNLGTLRLVSPSRG